ncbi:MAG: metal ABC transporter permease, partial [Planctomycetota bacterium]
PATALLRRRLVLCALDPECAHAHGLRPDATLTALPAAWAVAAGVALHATGMLFTLGMFVLPALFALRACRTAQASLFAAPAAAAGATLLGQVLSLEWDLPPGPLTVLFAAAAAAIPRR